MGELSTVGAGLIALAWLIALTVYDVTQRRLPNALTLPGAILILVAAVPSGRGAAAALGALALALPYLAVHLVAPAALGAGDVKLALGIGALTGTFGVDAWILAAIAAPLVTALWALAAWRPQSVRTTARRDLTVPHGPSMCVTAAAAVALVMA